jgi:hypothetical protein
MALRPDNKKDKQRFEKMKQKEQKHVRVEPTAINVAAKEVKELRQREGRSKDDGAPSIR